MSAATSTVSVAPATSPSDVAAAVIPYKNVPALASYYLGIFSLLPLIGLVTALFAVPLAIVGLRKRMKNPAARGAIHAIVGLVTGTLGLVVWGGLVALMLFAPVAS